MSTSEVGDGNAPGRGREGSGSRVQLWSYNFDPEPTGIGPISKLWADEMAGRGHQVEVVAAHPHYPEPLWGSRLRPYYEVREGVKVLRLPLWIGRATPRERVRQELTFMAALSTAAPFTGRPDIMVVVSPAFPALLPAILTARARRVPWILWLQDILPAGAAVTGLLDSGPVMRVSRWLERTAYKEADKIVLLSRGFAQSLQQRGVPDSKLEVIPNPATRGAAAPSRLDMRFDRNAPRVLSMGNIGHTQGLASLVRAFEDSSTIRELGVRLVIAGSGVAAPEVERQIRSDRVEMLGLVSEQRLAAELERASLALVSQRHAGVEFNLPSKLMNFMANGLPIIAAVDPAGEVARLIWEAEAGWIVDSARPEAFPEAVAVALSDGEELTHRGEAAKRYALEHFSSRRFGDRFDGLLRAVLSRR